MAHRMILNAQANELERLRKENQRLQLNLDDIKRIDFGMREYEMDRANRAEDCLVRAYKALRAQHDFEEPYSTHELAEETMKYLEIAYPELVGLCFSLTGYPKKRRPE